MLEGGRPHCRQSTAATRMMCLRMKEGEDHSAWDCAQLGLLGDGAICAGPAREVAHCARTRGFASSISSDPSEEIDGGIVGSGQRVASDTWLGATCMSTLSTYGE
jgi:hypothetical protein